MNDFCPLGHTAGTSSDLEVTQLAEGWRHSESCKVMLPVAVSPSVDRGSSGEDHKSNGNVYQFTWEVSFIYLARVERVNTCTARLL